MSARRFRPTKAAKFLLLVVVMALIGGGIFFGINSGLIKTSSGKDNIASIEKVKKESVNVSSDKDGNVINTEKNDNKTINLSLDEWIGWKSIIDANGGLSTKDGSIYSKLGINVNISIINDATQSSNAMVSGKIDAAGYTINRTAFLSKKFSDAGINVIMPYVTNFSNGGDGIIAKSEIKSVGDLVNAKIGVPQFSEAHSLVVWFVNQSDLSESDKSKIISNLILFETPDEAAKAFFAGQIDVAATWEPYLTQAQNMSGAHILFSTASSSSLIMDGILFNKAFAEKYPDVVSTFIDGALQASKLYDTDTTTIKTVMPMFSTASDQDILDNCMSAKLTTYADNMNLLNGTAKTIYSDMCNVWESIGETVNKELFDTVFDNKYISKLADKYDSGDITSTDAKVVVTEENKQEVLDTVALLQKSTSVNFIINTAKFIDSAEATKTLNDFIEISKVLDGTIIEIAGNTDPNPSSDPEDVANKMLSQQRAETVKQYFVLNGISADRIIVVGNGSSKPVVENDSEEHRAMNRRTDISFKSIE
uniref:phosphate ABC transporter substrate-binding/OmpA family protein n=1 Tax=Clostridium sp. 12(A) TaxID=1163671 RepID=UPI00046791FB|nr:phosphate ABC transporter substrate-binding/OmpA family protein [Clostridium sp. 12(A)]